MLLRTVSRLAIPCCVAVCVSATAAVCSAQAVREVESDSIPTPVQLVPGVLTTIPVAVAESATFEGPVPLPKLIQDLQALDYQPQTFPQSETLQAKARSAIMRHPAWALEFSFKPLRMIEVDVPLPTGRMEKKLVWYMVYRVTNRGQRIVPKAIVDRFGHETFGTEVSPEPLRFFPTFTLEGLVRDPSTKEFDRKVYLDRIVPIAIPEIQRRERPPMALLDSVSISRQTIPVTPAGEEGGLWGVATWTDIDPAIDYFSIFANGLTSEYDLEVKGIDDNAYRFKTLQLNFWRPGDAEDENESEIRYGVRLVDSPTEQSEILELYGQNEPLDYRWIFR